MIVGPHSTKLPQSWDTGSDQPSVPASFDVFLFHSMWQGATARTPTLRNTFPLTFPDRLPHLGIPGDDYLNVLMIFLFKHALCVWWCGACACERRRADAGGRASAGGGGRARAGRARASANERGRGWAREGANKRGRWAGAGRAGGFAFLNVESNITDLIQHFKLLCGTSHKVVAILTPPVEGSMLCSCWRAIDHPQSCFGQWKGKSKDFKRIQRFKPCCQHSEHLPPSLASASR